MRTLGIVALTLLSGCELFLGGAVAGAAIAPGMAGVAAGGEEGGDGYMEISYAKPKGDDEHGVEGGHGGGFSSAGFFGPSRMKLYASGRVEVGSYGRDGIYGFTGFDLGPGLELLPHNVLAVTAGYRYGGYPQI